MDVTRPYVDAVHGEPEGAPPLPLEPALVTFVRGEEVRADERCVGLEGVGIDGESDALRLLFCGREAEPDGSVSAPGGQQCSHDGEQ